MPMSVFANRFGMSVLANRMCGTFYSGNRLMTIDQDPRRLIRLTLRYKFNAAKSKYKGTGAGQDQRSRM